MECMIQRAALSVCICHFSHDLEQHVCRMAQDHLVQGVRWASFRPQPRPKSRQGQKVDGWVGRFDLCWLFDCRLKMLIRGSSSPDWHTPVELKLELQSSTQLASFQTCSNLMTLAFAKNIWRSGKTRRKFQWFKYEWIRPSP